MKTKNQILAINEQNRVSNSMLTEILPRIKDLQGHKVILTNGNKAAALARLVLPEPVKYQDKGVYFNTHCYIKTGTLIHGNCSIYLVVKTCINGGSYDDNTYFCIYPEVNTIYLGESNDGIFSIKTGEDWPIYTEVIQNECEELIKEFKQLQEKTRAIYYQIPETIRKAEYLTI